MARALERRSRMVFQEELPPLVEKPEENISDIFATIWEVAPETPTLSLPMPMLEDAPADPLLAQDEVPTLETQLVEVKAARESYAQFQVAAVGLGSSLISIFTSCGVACLAHGHGLASGVRSGFSLDLSALGHLHSHDHDHHHHDHEHEEKHPEPAKKPPAIIPPKKKSPVASSSQKPTKYIRPSDLGLFFLSSAVAV